MVLYSYCGMEHHVHAYQPSLKQSPMVVVIVGECEIFIHSQILHIFTILFPILTSTRYQLVFRMHLKTHRRNMRVYISGE